MKVFLALSILVILIFSFITYVEGEKVNTNSELAVANQNIQWNSKYNSPYNNPFSSKIFGSDNKVVYFSLSSISSGNEIIASKALVYSGIAYFITKTVNIYAVDLSTFNYNKLNLSVSNTSLNATPALIGGNCQTIAALDGISIVNFLTFGPGLSLSLINKYGPMNQYSHTIATDGQNYYVTSISSPSGYVYKFGCQGSVLNIYLLSPYEEPVTGVAVNSSRIFVLTSFGSAKAINDNSWTASLGLVFTQEPVLYKNLVIVRGSSSSDGSENLIALDAENGSIVWKTDIPSKIVSPIVIYNNSIFFLVYNSYLYQLNAMSGKILNIEKLQGFSFDGLNPDLIAMDSELIFTALQNNSYALVYYDTRTSSIEKVLLDPSLGKPIGISLTKGKIIVTLEKGIALLPIKAPSQLIITANPEEYKYYIKVNGTQYLMQPYSQLVLNFILDFNSTFQLEIQDKVYLNNSRYLYFTKWNNVYQYNFNRSIIKLNQWSSLNVTAYYNLYILTTVSLDYKILGYNMTLQKTPKLMIDGNEIVQKSIYVEENSNVNFIIYAEPLVILNSTASLVFQSWNDGSKTNSRTVSVRAGSIAHFDALYVINFNYTLGLLINPPAYTDVVVKYINSSLPINQSLNWIISPNTNITFEITKTIIPINNTFRLVFKNWTGTISSNSTRIVFNSPSKNILIIINFDIEKLFTFRVINYTYYENMKFVSFNKTIFESWKPLNNMNINIMINKYIYLSPKERLALISFNLTQKHNIISENSNQILLNVELDKNQSVLAIDYISQKYSTVKIVFNDPSPEFIYINGTKESIISYNATYFVFKEFWISDKINLNITARYQIKFSDTKYLLLKSLGNSNSNSIMVMLKPGDELVIDAVYEQKDVTLEASYLSILLVVVVIIIGLAIILRTFR